MPFSQNWVETEPDGGLTTVSQLDNWIRNTKIAIRERLEDTLFEAGSFAAAPVLRNTNVAAAALAGGLGTGVHPLPQLTMFEFVAGQSTILGVLVPGMIATSQIAQVSVPNGAYPTHPKMQFGFVSGAQWLWPCIPSVNVGMLPPTGVNSWEGLIAIEGGTRLVLFSGSQRHYINFDGTF